jgi:hypothetical protein
MVMDVDALLNNRTHMYVCIRGRPYKFSPCTANFNDLFINSTPRMKCKTLYMGAS